MKIYFDGKESTIIKITANLPRTGTTAVICRGNSIQFGTPDGAKQVFIGDTVVIEGDSVTIEDY